jgi:carboxypeptidase family protein/TonB-dependent receptor-like protein
MGRMAIFGLIAIMSVAAPLITAVNPAAAQETVNHASVSGQVTDSSGGVIVAAEVMALQAETNVASTTVTDREGRFRFPYLRAGTYDFTVRAKGFALARRRLTLTVGAAFDLPISIGVGPVDTEITVTADSTLLEAARSQIAGTVRIGEVEQLPLNGRNVLDVALLIPGVSPTNVGGGTQLFPETSAVPGVGLSIGSQRNLSNNFMVDGLSANDDAAGLSGMSYSVDSVDQFQVVTSGGQAELGRALGGHINIATRSGTNRLRADTSAYFRDDRFNGVNALSGAKLPMHQNQYSVSTGGPIARDRTFFFSSFEQRRLDQSGLVTISPEVVDVVNARLTQVGYGGPPVTTGIYPNPVDTTHFLAKTDHHVSAADHVTVRYSLYDAASSNARGAGGTNAPSASAGLDNLDQTIAVGNVLTLSTRTVLETRAQFAYGDLKAAPTDAVGPAVNIAGVAVFGTLSGSPTGRVNRMTQIVNNLSHQAGGHALRAGVDLLYNDLDITFPRSVRGGYVFPSLTAFLAGSYNNLGFTQTFGDTAVSQTNPNLGIYLQDEWRVSSRVTLNAGVRYDLQFLQTINTDTNNVSPRFGVVWSPFDSRQTVIRANGGRFYDRIPLRALANALLSAANTTDLTQLRQLNVTLSPAQTGAPVFPNILSDIVPTTTPVNLTTMDRHIQNAYSDQVSVEIEQQIGPQSTVSVGYDRLRGRHLIMQINQNVPSCPVAGANNGCRPIASYANNNQYSAVGSSEYDGLHVSFLQRPAGWGSYRLSYSFSKSMNDVGETFFSSPIDPFDLSKDWGRSDDDQRHRLAVTGTLNSPSTPATNFLETISHGFQLTGMLQYYSALPFNITTGTNTVHGTAARPTVNGAFIERNAGEGGDFSTVSLRVMRTFRLKGRAQLDGLIEAFNLFDRRNELARVTVFGSGAYPTNPAANYRQVTVVGDPRSIQFGVRFRYGM